MAEQKSIQRTFRIETEGSYWTPTPQALGGLKQRLTTEAKKEKAIDAKGELGDLSIVSTTERIGHHVDVTVSAPVLTKKE